ncbi:MAG: PKD domain-containing protein [Bacteroidota bacterium]
MSNKLPIEDLFRSALEPASLAPSPELWEKTARTLRRQRFLRFTLRRFNIYYLTVLTGVVLTTLILTTRETANTPGTRDDKGMTQPVDAKSIAEPVPEVNGSEDLEVTDHKKSTPVRRRENSSGKTRLTEKSDGQVVTPDKKDSDNAAPSDTTDKTMAEVPLRPLALFITDSESGCVPFRVQLTSLSQNASRYSWSFGNGTASNEESPFVTYQEPGTYLITLTVYNEDKEAASYTRQVEALPSPVTDFEISENGEQIHLLNYSRGAVSYEWSYSAGSDSQQFLTSDMQPPALEISRLMPKGYGNKTSVKLMLTLSSSSINNCRSTLTREITVQTRPPLTFPTAFSPNPSGPSTGTYSPTSPDNEVFHPVWKNEPLSYHLRIFNRAGELVFETFDLYTGWDGYLTGTQVAAGVYVWKCEGTDINGEPFIMKGDITLIWK